MGRTRDRGATSAWDEPPLLDRDADDAPERLTDEDWNAEGGPGWGWTPARRMEDDPWKN